MTLIRCQKVLKNLKGADEDETTGVKIVSKALEEPLRRIVINSGGEGSVVVQAIREAKDAKYGFDAEKMVYGDMVKFGIVDPAKVTRAAVENAASIASMIITTEALITEIKEKQPVPGMPPGGGGMGEF